MNHIWGLGIYQSPKLIVLLRKNIRKAFSKGKNFAAALVSRVSLAASPLNARARACTPLTKSEEKGRLLAVYENPEYLKFWELAVTHDVNVSSKFDSFKIRKTTFTFQIHINSFYGSKLDTELLFVVCRFPPPFSVCCSGVFVFEIEAVAVVVILLFY